jgi:hypothetical protein
MKILVQHDYKATRKEPFGIMLRRLHDALTAAEIPVAYQFVFSDSAVAGGVSAVNRAVKKFPQLAALVQATPAAWAAISGAQVIQGEDKDLPFATLAEVADGLPRSLPFSRASVRFHGPAFGSGGSIPMLLQAGILAADNWWINGRNRALSVGYFVEVEKSSKKLPAPEGPLGALLAAFGKPKKINQYPLPGAAPEGAAPENDAEQPATLSPAAVKELTQQIRARLPQLVEQAAMPQSLPPVAEALAARVFESHPLKPTLERFFRPLGYSCKGGSGTFSLRRRTAGNHVVEVDLDVGTWSRSVIAHFKVHAPGARCTFGMPVAPGLAGAQYPIGDAAQWEKIVENLAVLAAHFDREVVPEIEAAVGPAPEWFEAPQ